MNANLVRWLLAGALGAGVFSTTGRAEATWLEERKYPDFNGDGCSDLPIGAPLEDVGTTQDAGSVTIIYCDPAGTGKLNPSGAIAAQVWTLASAGIPGTPAANDQFARALGWGDFDDDGYGDLAVGIPRYAGHGAIVVIYGSATGLSSGGAHLFEMSDLFAGHPSHAGDQFGAALAAGDFNGDGTTDLAIGVPGRDRPTSGFNLGAAVIIYGFSGIGLSGTFSTYWQPLAPELPLSAPAWSIGGPQFGFALAAGSSNNDLVDELAVGAPRLETPFLNHPGGGVVVLKFNGFALESAAELANPAISVSPYDASDARFGSSLSMNDLGGDGKDELVVGSPGLRYTTVTGSDHGGFEVFIATGASPAGYGGATTQVISQGTSGVSDSPESGDEVGRVVATGDFTNDGRADVAIGVPFETVNNVSDGIVQVFTGGTNGVELSLVQQRLYQDDPNVAGIGDGFDRFGFSLIVGNFDDGASADLAVGIPGETCTNPLTFRSYTGAGAVEVFWSTTTFQEVVSTVGEQIWNQDMPGVPDQCEVDDNFGLMSVSFP